LRMNCMGSVNVLVATLPFSKTSFSAKMQPRIFFLVAPSTSCNIPVGSPPPPVPHKIKPVINKKVKKRINENVLY